MVFLWEETRGRAQPYFVERHLSAENSLLESEQDLIRQAASGDARAFHRLVDAHGAYLFAIACAMLGKGPDAEDAVQDTFLAAMKGLKRFEGRSALRTWLVSILVRQVAVLRRKRRFWEVVDLEAVVDRSASARQAADAKMDVMHVLQQLSPEHRGVLVMRELEGMTYEEIAVALGVPKGTVESRLYRARQEIKARFGEFG